MAIPVGLPSYHMLAAPLSSWSGSVSEQRRSVKVHVSEIAGRLDLRAPSETVPMPIIGWEMSDMGMGKRKWLFTHELFDRLHEA